MPIAWYLKVSLGPLIDTKGVTNESTNRHVWYRRSGTCNYLIPRVLQMRVQIVWYRRSGTCNYLITRVLQMRVQIVWYRRSGTCSYMQAES